MSKIDGVDFGRYKHAMVERFGFTEVERDSSWNDLMIILNAMEREPQKSFALTVGADHALHGLLLDTMGHFQISQSVFGPGALMIHDPFAYGTPAFVEAWENTRAAFAAEGIELPADWRAGAAKPDARSAEACVMSVQQVSDASRNAEACVLTVGQVADASRNAEACVLTVGQVADASRNAEACVLSVKQTAEMSSVS